MHRVLWVALSIGLTIGMAVGQAPATPAPVPATTTPARPPAPVRDPNTPGYVKAKELPDGAIPPANVDGNFIIGPTHNRAPEFEVNESVPQGNAVRVHDEFGGQQVLSGDCAGCGHVWHGRSEGPGEAGGDDEPSGTVYAARCGVCAEAVCSGDRCAVHCWGGRSGSRVAHDARQHDCAASVAGDDWRSSSAMAAAMRRAASGAGVRHHVGQVCGVCGDRKCCRWWRSKYGVKLTRILMGGRRWAASSGGSAALIMAWYHPELYHRVLTYSGTYVNQQWPHDDADSARRVGVS